MIDPKGDLTNLLLTFPDLRTGRLPAVGQRRRRAARRRRPPTTSPRSRPTKWTDGLAGVGSRPERMSARCNAGATTIYTPGSTAGVPLNLVGSLQAPTDTADPEIVHDEVEGFVTGLLALVGIDADPLSSREHILLSNMIATAWSAARDLDLPTLVGQVQNPPIRKLGVFDLDTFFPPRTARRSRRG